MIIEIPSTSERVEARILEDEPAGARAPIAVTLGPKLRAWYTLAPMVDGGWRIVEASPQERAVLAARGIMVQER